MDNFQKGELNAVLDRVDNVISEFLMDGDKTRILGLLNALSAEYAEEDGEKRQAETPEDYKQELSVYLSFLSRVIANVRAYLTSLR